MRVPGLRQTHDPPAKTIIYKSIKYRLLLVIIYIIDNGACRVSAKSMIRRPKQSSTIQIIIGKNTAYHWEYNIDYHWEYNTDYHWEHNTDYHWEYNTDYHW